MKVQMKIEVTITLAKNDFRANLPLTINTRNGTLETIRFRSIRFGFGPKPKVWFSWITVKKFFNRFYGFPHQLWYRFGYIPVFL